MERNIRFIGLDVHKELISVAIAEDRRGCVSSFGEILNTPASISKLAKKLAGKGEYDLCFAYEAGCFGFLLHRQLTALGHTCIVAAPSLIPRKPGIPGTVYLLMTYLRLSGFGRTHPVARGWRNELQAC